MGSTWNIRARPALLLLVIFAGLSTDAAETGPTTGPAAESHRPVRLLFAGSSSTYWNDLPGEVAKRVNGRVANRPAAKVAAEIVGRSGSDIRVYDQPGFSDYEYGIKPGQTFLQKVRDERFDFVVLQAVAGFALGEQDPENRGGSAHLDAITKYCNAIRTAGAEPVIYEMGWGRYVKPERTAEGCKRLFDLAVKARVRMYVPCASAWLRVGRERPAVQLLHPDDVGHPGDLGHFLNVACFYAAFTGQSPEGKLLRAFHVWPHYVTKDQKAAHAEEMEAAFATFKPDAYQALLPRSLQLIAGAKAVGKVDEETARFLERVAWETWRDTSERLAASHGK